MGEWQEQDFGFGYTESRGIDGACQGNRMEATQQEGEIS